jgi:hypothetical protein
LFLTLISLILSNVCTYSQHIDSTLESLQQIPTKYITGIDKKVDQYTSRITSKTEKTLTKLSRWEIKIKGLLVKTSPETAERLFGGNQPTFTSLLEKIKEGEAIALQYKAPYDKYRDDVTTSLKYLAQQKQQLDSGLIKKVKATRNKMDALAVEEDKSEAVQQFIKERKNALIAQTFKYIGKSKYLTKINKESFYYIETLKNYKELFSDSKKAEQTAKTILNRIPAFQQFMQKNSMLASLFGQPGGGDLAANSASLAGLQTRASVQSLIQDRIAAGGPNAQQAFSQNLLAAQAAISKLNDKLLNPAAGVGGSSGGELPDFTPNMEKTKTFKQRIEYGFNLQFAKTNSLLPSTSDIAASVGYKVNNKSVIGLALSYKLGLGNIKCISLSHQGIGLRSFIDWKLKKQFFITGGYELNHNAQFQNIAQLKNYNAWQRSALIGLTKKISIKTKWFKTTNVVLLYDFLSYQHVPASQPVLFRVGYGF